METAEKKVKRSVRKKEKLRAIKEASSSGPATARLKNVPTSPRKMRLVADLIRGQRVNKALNILKYESMHPSSASKNFFFLPFQTGRQRMQTSVMRLLTFMLRRFLLTAEEYLRDFVRLHRVAHIEFASAPTM